jgi:hypothetical protein
MVNNKLRNPVCHKRCTHHRIDLMQNYHQDQGGNGFVDSLKNLFSGAKKVVSTVKDVAFGDVGTAISNALPDSDQNARPLYSGEMHAFLRLPDGKMGRANYMGPGTHLVDRLKRADPPRTFSDKESQAHDSRYFLAKSPDDVKRADLKMVDVMQRAKRNKLDDPINVMQGLRLIQAKNKLETMTGKNFVDYGPGKGEESGRPLVEAKLSELEKEGFGKKPKPPGYKLKNKLIKQVAAGKLKPTAKNTNRVSNMEGTGVITDGLEYLSGKAGHALLPLVKKLFQSRMKQYQR